MLSVNWFRRRPSVGMAFRVMLNRRAEELSLVCAGVSPELLVVRLRLMAIQMESADWEDRRACLGVSSPALSTAAIAYHTALGPDVYMTPWGFSGVMNSKLRQNDHKSHWSGMTPSDVLAGLRGEIQELSDELPGGDTERIIREAADVANFAFFAHDNARRGVWRNHHDHR